MSILISLACSHLTEWSKLNSYLVKRVHTVDKLGELPRDYDGASHAKSLPAMRPFLHFISYVKSDLTLARKDRLVSDPTQNRESSGKCGDPQ